VYEIKEPAFAVQPRERLAAYGPESLNEQELLSILLRTGTKQKGVQELARQILERFRDLESFKRASLAELQEMSGIGKVKAIELQAMIEFGKRVQASRKPHGRTIYGSHDIGLQMIAELSDLEQEHLVAIYLDTRNHIIQKRTIYIGTVNSSPAVPRDILNIGVRLMTSKLIVIHNHPSGALEPSKDDFIFTENLQKACHSLGFLLIDHLIIAGGNYLSFREKNLL
jgi:DNA repair protein RadC